MKKFRMNIRRLTAVIFAATALLPFSAFVSPLHAQTFGEGGDPSFGGGGNVHVSPPVSVPAPIQSDSPAASSSLDLSAGHFASVIAGAAARHFPRPPAWSGHSNPAAETLPVSPDSIRLRLYNAKDLRGAIEARIATDQGLFYVFDTETGAEILPASAITDISRRVNLGSPILGKVIPAGKNTHVRSYPGWTHTSAGWSRSSVSHSSVSHSSVSHSFLGSTRPASGGGFAAGPGDGGGQDYARAIGAADNPVLSTGWTSGHGKRTEHVHDYYRHTKSGGLVYVHSYYRRSH